MRKTVTVVECDFCGCDMTKCHQGLSMGRMNYIPSINIENHNSTECESIDEICNSCSDKIIDFLLGITKEN